VTLEFSIRLGPSSSNRSRQTAPLQDLSQHQIIKRLPQIILKSLLNLAVFLALVGCAQTKIPYTSQAPSIYELASANQHPVILETAVVPSGTVGYQYLFIVLPFGYVEIEDLSDTFRQIAYEELAIAGYRPVSKTQQNEHTPVISLTLMEMQLGASDLLVTRRLFAEATISARLALQRGAPIRTLERTAQVYRWSRYGFAPQLEVAMREGLRQACREVLAGTLGS